MKVVEILELGSKFFELLQKSCIRMNDYQYVPMYKEYMEIVKCGGKATYAIAVLSEKYGISERKAYYIIKRFAQDCIIGAG